MFAFAVLVLVLLFRPARHPRQKWRSMMMVTITSSRRRAFATNHGFTRRTTRGTPDRALDRQRDYLITVLILILYLAYTGPSVEHHDGLCRAALARPCDLCRARRLCRRDPVHALRHRSVARTVGRNSRRRGLRGDHQFSRFPVLASPASISAILTIAFAEFARIGFDHLEYLLNALGRAVLRQSRNTRTIDLWQASAATRRCSARRHHSLSNRCWPSFFCRVLLKSRAGDRLFLGSPSARDEPAARAAGINTFSCKMYAVMISAAVTSFAGVF